MTQRARDLRMANPRTAWRRVRFADMVTSAGATRKARGWTAGDSGVNRYVGLEHLDSNCPRIRRWGSPETVGENSDLRHFEPGDVILARRGIEQRKVGMAEFRGVASGHALVLRARPETVLPAFLPYFLLSDLFMTRALQFSAGSLSKTVNLSALMKQEFALPPLEVQENAVAALRAITDVEYAYQGLVDSTSMLARSFCEDLFRNASSFPTRSVRELCRSGRPLCYGVVQPGESDDAGVPLIRVCDLDGFGHIESSQQLARISAPVDRQYARSRVIQGDVVVSIVGTIGRVAVIPDTHAGHNIARALARISPIANILPEYLAGVLQTPTYQHRLVAESYETARKTLNLSTLGELPIPVPDVSTQQVFVDRLEAITRARDDAGMRADACRAVTRAILSSLWTK
jgi:type I restriction enzyme, S subunit